MEACGAVTGIADCLSWFNGISGTLSMYALQKGADIACLGRYVPGGLDWFGSILLESVVAFIPSSVFRSI